MNKSDTTNKIAAALAAFQSECPSLGKNTQGYGYKYTDLPTIKEKIQPLLTKNGLAISQVITSPRLDFVGVETILMHISGEWISGVSEGNISENKGKGMSLIQAQGSVVTYLRRYSLSAILGIVTDEDTDGHVKEPSKKEYKKPNPPVDEIYDTIQGYMFQKKIPVETVVNILTHQFNVKKYAQLHPQKRAEFLKSVEDLIR